MKNVITMKEERFSFFADSQEEKRYANAQLAHCLLPDTQANALQKSKSQFLPSTLNILITIKTKNYGYTSIFKMA